MDRKNVWEVRLKDTDELIDTFRNKINAETFIKKNYLSYQGRLKLVDKKIKNGSKKV